MRKPLTDLGWFPCRHGMVEVFCRVAMEKVKNAHV